MNTLNQIQFEVAALPVNLQAEVLDFVRFVKQRRSLSRAVPEAASASTDTGDSPLFQTLTDAGFVGCVDTNEQHSTQYKSQLDFSAEVGLLIF